MGITDAKLKELSKYKESALFSTQEKTVLKYTDEMTSTPVLVSDSVFDELYLINEAIGNDQKIIDAWGWITLKISSLSGSVDYNILDQRIIDGVSHITNFFSKKLRKTQSGVLQNYLLAGFAGSCCPYSSASVYFKYQVIVKIL